MPDPVVNYTVSFDANGGTGTGPSAQTVTAGSAIAIPNESGLAKSGYTFDGWNTNAAGTGTNYSAGSSYTVNGNVTLYAKWTQNPAGTFTVTFNSNGGTGTTPSAQTITKSSAITIPNGNGLSKSGCTFGGWNTRHC